ncbi:MAG TPA: hypothetical protein VMC09_16580 [Anaerolineales bacterium]|nr:hypothetical protein [Anaerolineales bacterium]
MKRLILPLALSFAILLACPFSGKVQPGSQVKSMLGDPQVGLASLKNYHATLKVTFQGTQAGQTVDLTDSYDQTIWLTPAAHFTTIDTTDAGGSHQFVLAGQVGSAQYYQADAKATCGVYWDEAATPADFLVASLLPAVGIAKLVDEPSVDGIPTEHYTFDASGLGLPSDATANGETWLAQSGGYVVKYVLDITGADSMFGAGVQGTRHMEYELSDMGAQAAVVYPAGCEPVLDLPAMDNVTDLTRLPGLLSFTTRASAKAVFSFYQDKLTALGWQKSSDSGIGSDSATTTYIRSDSGDMLTVEADTQAGSCDVTVMAPSLASSAASTTSPATTPGADQTQVSGSPVVVVTKSVNLLIGTDSKPSALPSFHLESQLLTPVWSGGKIAQDRETMTADVQGQNVHFIDQTKKAGGSNQTAEAYLMGKQDYDVVNGKVQPAGVSMTALTWKMWPLDLVMILATGATDAKASGTETLEGRTAEVYTLNVSGATAPAVAGIGLPVTAVSGKVWIDQQTGALLKAVLDFQADVHDSSGNPQGSGSGHLEITVTKVGQVTVTLPAH